MASDQKVALDLDQLTLADVDGALLDGLKIDFSVTARRLVSPWYTRAASGSTGHCDTHLDQFSVSTGAASD
jgi:hypothetical protein